MTILIILFLFYKNVSLLQDTIASAVLSYKRYVVTLMLIPFYPSLPNTFFVHSNIVKNINATHKNIRNHGNLKNVYVVESGCANYLATLSNVLFFLFSNKISPCSDSYTFRCNIYSCLSSNFVISFCLNDCFSISSCFTYRCFISEYENDYHSFINR